MRKKGASYFSSEWRDGFTSQNADKNAVGLTRLQYASFTYVNENRWAKWSPVWTKVSTFVSFVSPTYERWSRLVRLGWLLLVRGPKTTSAELCLPCSIMSYHCPNQIHLGNAKLLIVMSWRATPSNWNFKRSTHRIEWLLFQTIWKLTSFQ